MNISPATRQLVHYHMLPIMHTHLQFAMIRSSWSNHSKYLNQSSNLAIIVVSLTFHQAISPAEKDLFIFFIAFPESGKTK
uniref:Uncharacterized protein n=1 Tax=Arundo donax TaxID=35708 RepID=A0A0A9HZS1_ARUDO